MIANNSWVRIAEDFYVANDFLSIKKAVQSDYGNVKVRLQQVRPLEYPALVVVKEHTVEGVVVMASSSADVAAFIRQD